MRLIAGDDEARRIRRDPCQKPKICAREVLALVDEDVGPGGVALELDPGLDTVAVAQERTVAPRDEVVARMCHKQIPDESTVVLSQLLSPPDSVDSKVVLKREAAEPVDDLFELVFEKLRVESPCTRYGGKLTARRVQPENEVR